MTQEKANVISTTYVPLVLSPAVPTGWPRVEIVHDEKSFAALRGEWDELLDDSTAGIFNSWAWLYSWYRWLGGQRKLRILVARAPDGRLLGILPLAMETRRAVGRRIRRLAFLGETHVGSDYLDVVARKGYESVVTRAFAVALQETRATWDVLDLLDLDAQSPTIALLREAFPAPAFTIELHERGVCPYEPFQPGETFPIFLRRTRRRENYQRRRKWLEQQPGYRITQVTDPAHLEPGLSEFLRLHAMRWADDGGSQAITHRRVAAFHQEVTRLLAERGQLCLYMMYMDETPLASVYGIIYRDTFMYYLSGYDPAWGAKSVGLVLIGETFQDSFARGLGVYDFLNGAESYKSDWTTQEHQTAALRIYATRGAGRWLTRHEHLDRRMRTFVKRNLPVGMADKLRGLLHKLNML